MFSSVFDKVVSSAAADALATFLPRDALPVPSSTLCCLSFADRFLSRYPAGGGDGIGDTHDIDDRLAGRASASGIAVTEDDLEITTQSAAALGGRLAAALAGEIRSKQTRDPSTAPVSDLLAKVRGIFFDRLCCIGREIRVSRDDKAERDETLLLHQIHALKNAALECCSREKWCAIVSSGGESLVVCSVPLPWIDGAASGCDFLVFDPWPRPAMKLHGSYVVKFTTVRGLQLHLLSALGEIWREPTVHEEQSVGADSVNISMLMSAQGSEATVADAEARRIFEEKVTQLRRVEKAAAIKQKRQEVEALRRALARNEQNNAHGNTVAPISGGKFDVIQDLWIREKLGDGKGFMSKRDEPSRSGDNVCVHVEIGESEQLPDLGLEGEETGYCNGVTKDSSSSAVEICRPHADDSKLQSTAVTGGVANGIHDGKDCTPRTNFSRLEEAKSADQRCAKDQRINILNKGNATSKEALSSPGPMEESEDHMPGSSDPDNEGWVSTERRNGTPRSHLSIYPRSSGHRLQPPAVDVSPVRSARMREKDEKENWLGDNTRLSPTAGGFNSGSDPPMGAGRVERMKDVVGVPGAKSLPTSPAGLRSHSTDEDDGARSVRSGGSIDRRHRRQRQSQEGAKGGSEDVLGSHDPLNRALLRSVDGERLADYSLRAYSVYRALGVILEGAVRHKEQNSAACSVLPTINQSRDITIDLAMSWPVAQTCTRSHTWGTVEGIAHVNVSSDRCGKHDGSRQHAGGDDPSVCKDDALVRPFSPPSSRETNHSRDDRSFSELGSTSTAAQRRARGEGHSTTGEALKVEDFSGAEEVPPEGRGKLHALRAETAVFRSRIQAPRAGLVAATAASVKRRINNDDTRARNAQETRRDRKRNEKNGGSPRDRMPDFGRDPEIRRDSLGNALPPPPPPPIEIPAENEEPEASSNKARGDDVLRKHVGPSRRKPKGAWLPTNCGAVDPSSADRIDRRRRLTVIDESESRYSRSADAASLVGGTESGMLSSGVLHAMERNSDNDSEHERHYEKQIHFPDVVKATSDRQGDSRNTCRRENATVTGEATQKTGGEANAKDVSGVTVPPGGSLQIKGCPSPTAYGRIGVDGQPKGTSHENRGPGNHSNMSVVVVRENSKRRCTDQGGSTSSTEGTLGADQLNYFAENGSAIGTTCVAAAAAAAVVEGRNHRDRGNDFVWFGQPDISPRGQVSNAKSAVTRRNPCRMAPAPADPVISPTSQHGRAKAMLLLKMEVQRQREIIERAALLREEEGQARRARVGAEVLKRIKRLRKTNGGWEPVASPARPHPNLSAEAALTRPLVPKWESQCKSGCDVVGSGSSVAHDEKNAPDNNYTREQNCRNPRHGEREGRSVLVSRKSLDLALRIDACNGSIDTPTLEAETRQHVVDATCTEKAHGEPEAEVYMTSNAELPRPQQHVAEATPDTTRGVEPSSSQYKQKLGAEVNGSLNPWRKVGGEEGHVATPAVGVPTLASISFDVTADDLRGGTREGSERCAGDRVRRREKFEALRARKLLEAEDRKQAQRQRQAAARAAHLHEAAEVCAASVAATAAEREIRLMHDLKTGNESRTNDAGRPRQVLPEPDMPLRYTALHGKSHSPRTPALRPRPPSSGTAQKVDYDTSGDPGGHSTPRFFPGGEGAVGGRGGGSGVTPGGGRRASPVVRGFSRRSNRKLVRNAINFLCLAGGHLSEQKARVLEALDSSPASNFVVLLAHTKLLTFKGLYSCDAGEDAPAERVFGLGPPQLDASAVSGFYKYNSAAREFREVHSKTLGKTTDAVSVEPTRFRRPKALTSHPAHRFYSGH